MSLRVIWQYMDRSVTKKILYGPQKVRSIYYFFGDGPVHILPYDPQCHELFAIYNVVSYYYEFISLNNIYFMKFQHTTYNYPNIYT